MKVLISVFVLALLLAACSSTPAPLPTAAAPNPASANCVAKGGTLDIRRETNGEVGYCKFADGSECEEWAYFRNECQPKTPNVPPTAVAGLPNPASANCIKQGGELVIRTDANGEVGYCQFPDGSECEEWALYRNECQPKSAAAATPTAGVTVMVPLVSGAVSTPQSAAPGLANPASTNCVDKGGTLEIRTDASGGEVGYCHFSDGSECEEWALLRGECQPGSALATPIPPTDSLIKPIVVQPGASRAAVTDSLAANGVTRYSLPALVGQVLFVNLTMTQGSAILQILGADGTVLLPDKAGLTSWSGQLPSTQDYIIEVHSVTNIATDYQLEVSLPAQ